ncbi:ABC transporter ATP-binding protein [Clostridiaceae bacterium UIB06]|uniref:ABC transporter ATP-binding protein n=1 Tax=Clostridium thailandense TaxID=2794346 RepID=A0A949TMU1_9CLOT|nr:ABC transporter ATP-binding protein [Clostridium thailandense]MBV7275280.1 ABC transporter ATP-binding protein [Clostridium thailandense]MCH5135796.1 ABC transporter ATP-binding protein [Clostridiaceae bacterium UIB06]
MNVAIQVENLVKSYGANIVINNISFAVNRGEIFALLGTNGAGKTTTLECIEGIRKYESGNIKVNGNIGVQLQSSSLPANIKAIEAYRLFYKWKKAQVNFNLFNVFELEQLKDKQYKEMSTGQKRRLHLALALIGNPDIIFLDEPTAGLDVEGRVSLHSQIRKLKEQGKTIIMASHDMAEVESLCDRIAILKDGKIAFVGTTIELTNKEREQCKIFIKTESALKNADYEQGYWAFASENIGDTLYELLETCRQTQNKVLDVKIERATLEQRFIDIAKEEDKQ